jgi:carbon storage regulator
MLVLSRKSNERIRIGEIEVVVLEIRGKRVRLGISAPREISVERAELTQPRLSTATQPTA